MYTTTLYTHKSRTYSTHVGTHVQRHMRPKKWTSSTCKPANLQTAVRHRRPARRACPRTPGGARGPRRVPHTLGVMLRRDCGGTERVHILPSASGARGSDGDIFAFFERKHDSTFLAKSDHWPFQAPITSCSNHKRRHILRYIDDIYHKHHFFSL